MKSLYLVLALILSLSATTRVEATNDEILQEFLGSLCEVNTVGAYASCCSNNANGTSVTTSNLPGCFGYTNSYLSSLSIVDKGLSVIPSGVFSNFTNLESLDINSNPLTTIESGAFEGLGSVNYLDLHSNSITELPSGAFKGLSNLRYLLLNSLSLSTIVSGTFEGLGNLISLNLYKSSIAELPSGAFKDLSNLQSLYLQSNSLTKLVTGTFEGLNNLASLNLQYNSLVYLEENIFGSNTNLPSLYLSFNNLITLPDRLSTSTALPRYFSVTSNCLDCNRYTRMSYVTCYGQYDTYCPITTNLCNTRNKFQEDNCFKCNSSGTDAFCDVCMPGYKHTVSGCGCVKCEEGESCVFGEVRVPSTVCAGCSSSLPSKCSSCAMDYKYVNGDCAACGNNECCPGGDRYSISILNCTSCNENRTGCYSCEVGTKYVPIGDEPYGECTKCGNNECCVGKTYTEGCARCMDDMSGCKTCHVGYYPVNGECLVRRERECWPEDWNGSIKIEHCISCKDEEKGCALCDKEYRNQGGVCVEKGKYVDGGSMKMSWMMMIVMAFVVACVSVIGWI